MLKAPVGRGGDIEERGERGKGEPCHCLGSVMPMMSWVRVDQQWGAKGLAYFEEPHPFPF